jgi:hypothetical protein
MMYRHEKSDPEIAAIRTDAAGMRREKPTNKAVPTAAELVERRAGTKGNAGQQSTLRAQDRATAAECSAETLGLTVAEGKMTLAGLQRHLVQAQAEEHCRRRCRCDYCGAQRPLKDFRRRRLTSLYGVVEVRAPRFSPCRCGLASRRTLTPVAR